MKKITILIVLALLCSFFRVSAQKRFTSKPLSVGDTVPDLTIQNIINFKSSNIRLADYKNKLIILDFWMTTCAPCIRHLPILSSIQKRLGNELFILPVNSATHYDSPAKVAAFFKERRKAFDLPTVVMDTVLNNLFKPDYLGICVWIKNGIVTNITDGDEVTYDNVSKSLKHNNESIRNQERLSDDYTKPLFDNGNGDKLPSNYYMRSMIFPYSPSLVGGGMVSDSTGKVIRLSYLNYSIYTLLTLAYPQYNHFGRRVKTEAQALKLDDDAFSTDSARRKNLICYEAIFPGVTKANALQYAREDLRRCFPYTLDSVRIEDTCLVLTRSKSMSLKEGNPNDSRTNIEANIGLPIYLYNKPLSFLTDALENQNKIPVLNETGGNPSVWLDLPESLSDIKAVELSLKKQGLILKKEIRPVEYLVIKNRPITN